MWATQQTEKINREEEMERYARTTIRELMIYMVFVGILTVGEIISVVQTLSNIKLDH